jgi:glycosyltransferase involved in cell wall biosynthesis
MIVPGSWKVAQFRGRARYFDGSAWNAEEPADPAPWPLRRLRDAYRKILPLETRLRLHQKFFRRFIPGGRRRQPSAASVSGGQPFQRLREAKLEPELEVFHPPRDGSAQRLRLMLLTPYDPYPPRYGGVISTWQMIRYLGSRHDLTLVTFMHPEQTRQPHPERMHYLERLCGVAWSGPHPLESLPLKVRDRSVESMCKALRSIPTRRFHAAIIDQIFMAEYRGDIEAPAILKEHNIESSLLEQASRGVWDMPLPTHFENPSHEAALLRSYENRAWADFPVRTVVSEPDRAEMERRVTVGRTVLVPNGADPATAIPNLRPGSMTVLFAGALDYFPNIEATTFLAREIWPWVRLRNPQARLIVAGRTPAPAVGEALRGVPGVELRANPPSMRDIAAGCSITIAPLRLGGGVRIKILESMAWGLPVVSTVRGCEGILVEDGVHLLIRDDPREFAEAILELLANQELWRRLHGIAYGLVETTYSWSRVLAPLEAALRDLVRG